MRNLDAATVAQHLEYADLVDVLDQAFRRDVTIPARHHHTVPVANGCDATLLIMPAWDEAFLGIKTTAVMPDNATRGLPTVHATYQLMDRQTGTLLASLDGAELTARRTAAASALASRYLSRLDAAHLLMVGTGVLAPHLIRAHASQRALKSISVWGRNLEKAEAVVSGLAMTEVSINVAKSLKSAVQHADIISCATLASEPLVLGKWLDPGQHLDLVGGFTPTMREADDDATRRARIYVDTEDTIDTAGDICDPLKRGIFSRDDIHGTLFTLTDGSAPPPRPEGNEITLFKSAGTAIEDLASAVLAYNRASG